jgi:Tfp pilus assembly protein PilO
MNDPVSGRRVHLHQEALRFAGVSSRFCKRTDRDNNMATEGRNYARRKNQELVSKEEIDEELADIRKEIEKLALQMQQNARMDELALEIQQKAKSRWVYEWPMRKLKVKWPVKELMGRR